MSEHKRRFWSIRMVPGLRCRLGDLIWQCRRPYTLAGHGRTAAGSGGDPRRQGVAYPLPPQTQTAPGDEHRWITAAAFCIWQSRVCRFWLNRLLHRLAVPKHIRRAPDWSPVGNTHERISDESHLSVHLH